ncbi:ABC transporter substrate-binding protein [Deltaproteobacteria bacterium TL4]
MKILIYATLLAFVLAPSTLFASDQDEVSALVKEKIGNVMQILKSKELDKKTKSTKIIAEITPIFDFSLMARLSIDKRYWSKMSKKQNEEYSTLFVQRIQESYLEKLDLYTDEDIQFQEAQKVKSDRVEVMTYLVSKDDRKEMLYKFYKSKEGWKIYDVEILGVSIIKTNLSQYSSVLESGGIDALIEKLRSPDKDKKK